MWKYYVLRLAYLLLGRLSLRTLYGIAKRYGVSPAEIVRWNQLTRAARIFPGDRLQVTLAARAEKEEGQGGFR